jgi:hypothetical protein
MRHLRRLCHGRHLLLDRRDERCAARRLPAHLGEVEVLGIVSVSIELNLQLAYQPASGKAVGKATLTVSISVAFFETSVSIECERKFAGSSGDPILAQLVGPASAGDDPQPWLDYCTTFTPVA